MANIFFVLITFRASFSLRQNFCRENTDQHNLRTLHEILVAVNPTAAKGFLNGSCLCTEFVGFLAIPEQGEKKRR